MQNEIDEFFSSETVQRIQDNVEAFIAEMVAHLKGLISKCSVNHA